MTRARREALLAWYDTTARSLPWRETTDPYAILVSEVMTQQTQVARVVPHYTRFIERFPTVDALADAPLAPVLAAWSGLGYNRRAQFLHRAAARIATEGWPTSAAGLRELPGIGPYTAAAIACFAFGEAIAAVDTNMRRVVSRWEGRALHGSGLAAAAAAHLNSTRPTDWNQAVMDLGGRICTARNPTCDACPVASWCKDPTVYAPPSRQTTFRGSTREARGAVLKTLIATGSATAEALETASGLEPNRLRVALEALESEEILQQSNGHWALADG